MIADAIGVTKAAVYHQFHTKEAIVLGVIEVDVQPIEQALDEAEAAGPSLQRSGEPAGRRHRHGGEQPPGVEHPSNATRCCFGSSANTSHRAECGSGSSRFSSATTSMPPPSVRAAVLSAAIGAVAHPFIIDLDNDSVRDELLKVTRRLIFKPG